MKYTEEERLQIGQEIYDNVITKYEAAEKYGISVDSARTYMRLYRNVNGLPAKNQAKSSTDGIKVIRQSIPADMEQYQTMTREELIRELVKARINEARLKKGYEVKGDGAKKEYIALGRKNIR